MLVWLSKMVLSQHFCTGCWGCQKALQSLTPAMDWLDLVWLFETQDLWEMLLQGHILSMGGAALKGHIFYFLLLNQCAFCGSLPVYMTVGTPSSIVMEPDQDPLISYHSLGSREVPRKTHCMRSLEAECPHDMLPQYAPSRLYW